MISPSTPNTISGRNAFIELLLSEGVTHLFGNPGTTELPIMRPDVKNVGEITFGTRSRSASKR